MKTLLLYNPTSGRGRFKRSIPKIKQRFEKEGRSLVCYESKGPKDLEKIAEAKAKHYDVFLVSGGDGTIHEVINGMMRIDQDKRPSLAIIPSGTANDVAAILGVRRNLCRALDVLFQEQPQAIDVNAINDQYFIYTVACGILTKVSYDISRRRIKKYGYLAYVFEGMKDLLRDYSMPIEIIYDGQELRTTAVMILGLASNRVGGLRLKRFSNNYIDDGYLELRIFTKRRLFKRFRILSTFARSGKKLREDIQISAKNFDIHIPNHVKWNTDGEFATTGSVQIRVHKQALMVYMSDKQRRRVCR